MSSCGLPSRRKILTCWSEAERDGTQPGEKKALGGLISTLKEGMKTGSQTLQ